MISDLRRTSSVLAALLSIPPILLVAAFVSRLLPPAPLVPSVVGANDRQTDATHPRPKSPSRAKWSDAARPLAYRIDAAQ